MPDIDYRDIFRVFPSPTVLLSRDFRVLDANQEFLDLTGQPREAVVGQDFFEAFPRGRWDEDAGGLDRLRESLESVAATGEPDRLPMVRFDLELPGQPGVFDERYWNISWTAAQTGPGGEPAVLLGRSVDITPLVHQARRAQAVSG